MAATLKPQDGGGGESGGETGVGRADEADSDMRQELGARKPSRRQPSPRQASGVRDLHAPEGGARAGGVEVEGQGEARGDGMPVFKGELAGDTRDVLLDNEKRFVLSGCPDGVIRVWEEYDLDLQSLELDMDISSTGCSQLVVGTWFVSSCAQVRGSEGAGCESQRGAKSKRAEEVVKGGCKRSEGAWETECAKGHRMCAKGHRMCEMPSIVPKGRAVWSQSRRLSSRTPVPVVLHRVRVLLGRVWSLEH